MRISSDTNEGRRVPVGRVAFVEYGDDFITMFDFEPALRCIVDEIRNRVIKRLRTELGIDVTELKK